MEVEQVAIIQEDLGGTPNLVFQERLPGSFPCDF